MSDNELGFRHVKVVALAAEDADRVSRFYGETLGLPPKAAGDGAPGFLLGDILLLPKTEWYGKPTAEPNPRITIKVDDARRTESALRERGVRISDPVTEGDGFRIGSFLDSEGNKLWFCSEHPAG